MFDRIRGNKSGGKREIEIMRVISSPQSKKVFKVVGTASLVGATLLAVVTKAKEQ